MYQTAMKMNVLSPVNFNVRDADSLHVLEGNTCDVVKVRHCSVSRGLRQWYGAERELQELGGSGLFPSRISAANPEREERAELANIYLHYVLDIWIARIVKKRCRGTVEIVRYADDFVKYTMTSSLWGLTSEQK